MIDVATKPERVPREYCSYCGRTVQMFDSYYTEDGPVHLGCRTMTSGPSNARTRRGREYDPDFQAPTLAQQEYIRKTAFCYATLFHNPIKRNHGVRPRYRNAK